MVARCWQQKTHHNSFRNSASSMLIPGCIRAIPAPRDDRSTAKSHYHQHYHHHHYAPLGRDRALAPELKVEQVAHLCLSHPLKPTEETQLKRPQLKKNSLKKTPMKKIPLKKIPLKKTPLQKIPLKKIPLKKTPLKKPPPKKHPPLKKPHTDEIPTTPPSSKPTDPHRP